MDDQPRFHFKIASESWEFELVHRLNHKTFAEEIPQHEPNPSHRLVDRFHDENVYAVALVGRELAGMVAIRGARPFSLEGKLAHLDSYLPSGRSICELRLLAVESRFRSGPLASALLAYVWRHVLQQGYDLAIISATTRQLKLYAHLGFTPFGPRVGTPEARFQPMMLTMEAFAGRARTLFRNRSAPPSPIGNFLPGPVSIHDDVQRAFQRPPESHRAEGFAAEFDGVRAALCRLAGARRVELLLGSGTVANDAVAGQLSLETGRGLVLTNGEFGERLVDHARRFRLAFDVMARPWGKTFDRAQVEDRLARLAPGDWLWVVHGETSTGVLNDLESMKAPCQAAGVRLCVDAISSLGTVPVNLDGTYLASGVSGKGLGAYPGLAMVFYDHPLVAAPERLPRYLDLALYARHGGIPFTHSSNLLRALHAALGRVDWDDRFRELAFTSAWLRARVRTLGFEVIAPEADAAPGVVTIAVPESASSVAVAAELEQEGYLLSAHSAYLRRRNWIQICLMGPSSREQLAAALGALHQRCGQPATV
jgi:aspartate aminotransferase-like enzyme/GNAT superfamily N-acetyltransferase